MTFRLLFLFAFSLLMAAFSAKAERPENMPVSDYNAIINAARTAAERNTTRQSWLSDVTGRSGVVVLSQNPATRTRRGSTSSECKTYAVSYVYVQSGAESEALYSLTMCPNDRAVLTDGGMQRVGGRPLPPPVNTFRNAQNHACTGTGGSANCTDECGASYINRNGPSRAPAPQTRRYNNALGDQCTAVTTTSIVRCTASREEVKTCTAQDGTSYADTGLRASPPRTEQLPGGWTCVQTSTPQAGGGSVRLFTSETCSNWLGATSDRGAMPAISQQDILNMQRKLASLYYLPDDQIDGSIGNNTSAAAEQFLADERISQPLTLAALVSYLDTTIERNSSAQRGECDLVRDGNTVDVCIRISESTED